MDAFAGSATRLFRITTVKGAWSATTASSRTSLNERAEEALRRSEERFDLAVRGTDVGIWDWDLRADTVYFSPRWKSMLGYEDHEIGNAFREWESRLHPEDRRRARSRCRITWKA